MLSKVIMGSRDIVRSTQEAQRLALLFDKIMIWPLDRKQVDREEAARTDAELEFLRASGVALKVGTRGPGIISFQRQDGAHVDPFDMSAGCDLVLPFGVVLTNPSKDLEFEHPTDRVIHGVARQLAFENVRVPAYMNPTILGGSRIANPAALEITLMNLPVPTENLPWDDFLQFRADAENIARLRALRLWIRKQATSVEAATHMQDELESLLHDYRSYMKIQKIKFGDGVLSTLLTSTMEIVGHVASLNFGSALKTMLQVRAHSLALSEAELLAPGREVSYIARTQAWIQNQ